MRAKSRSGRIGRSVIVTPRGASAFSTAEASAAGAAMVPLSAAPLTPSGLSGVGDSMCRISIGGTHGAVGSR